MVEEFVFPIKTLEWMIDTVIKGSYIHGKLLEIMKLGDYNKMNRWFGYYQKHGENMKYWTLDEIIVKVRNERHES